MVSSEVESKNDIYVLVFSFYDYNEYYYDNKPEKALDYIQNSYRKDHHLYYVY